MMLFLFDSGKFKKGKEIFSTEFKFVDFIQSGFKQDVYAPPISKSSDYRFCFQMSVIPTNTKHDDISSIAMQQLTVQRDSDGLQGLSGTQIKQSYAFVKKFTDP